MLWIGKWSKLGENFSICIHTLVDTEIRMNLACGHYGKELILIRVPWIIVGDAVLHTVDIEMLALDTPFVTLHYSMDGIFDITFQRRRKRRGHLDWRRNLFFHELQMELLHLLDMPMHASFPPLQVLSGFLFHSLCYFPSGSSLK